ELIIPMIMADMVDVGVAGGDAAYLMRQGGIMVGCALVSMALGVGIGFVGSFFTIRRHLKV
uniref:hypothetical protein n=1 Tax=Clostridium sp. TaxID=1506 RepID=UPI00307939F3